MISKIVRYMAKVKTCDHITISTIMKVFFVLTLPLVLGSAMSLPIQTCAYDEFYCTTLETCVSCEQICYEGSWGDCEKRCHDYYLTLKKCQYYQFWDRNLEICINCSNICHPISNDCTSRCKRYIQHSNTTSRATTATPLTTVTTTITNPKINNTQHQTLSLILVITIPCSIVTVFLAIVTIIMYITGKTRKEKDKKPIQESDNVRDDMLATNNRGHVDLNNPSTGLLDPSQRESEV